MKDSLLSILACPSCQGDLTVSEPRLLGEAIWSGALFCSTCRIGYPIREGIPRFVGDLRDRGAAAFDHLWARSGFRDEYSWGRQKRDLTALSDVVLPPDLSLDLSAHDWVLDAGCGWGAYVEGFAQTPAQVVGVDITRSVDRAAERLADSANVQFVQCDIMALPFRANAFRFAYSMGVLHYLPDINRGMRELRRVLQPGSALAGWVYPRTGGFRTALVSFVNYVGCRLPHTWAYALCRAFAPALNLVKTYSGVTEKAAGREAAAAILYFALSPRFRMFESGQIQAALERAGFLNVDNQRIEGGFCAQSR